MRANSRTVTSNQTGQHPALARTVRRHLSSRHCPPVADHDRRACEELLERLEQSPRPLVLDSFCGTGHSTRTLARRHPDHLVAGVDKSAHRLGRHPGVDNGDYLLLQADCSVLWRLLAEAGVRADYHYLLYPNPWPKARHLGRRVHGHPGLAALLALGGRLELRSNWQLYVEEFCAALHLADRSGTVERVPEGESPLSLFEKKYRDSGHALWRCRAAL